MQPLKVTSLSYEYSRRQDVLGSRRNAKGRFHDLGFELLEMSKAVIRHVGDILELVSGLVPISFHCLSIALLKIVKKQTILALCFHLDQVVCKVMVQLQHSFNG